MVHKIQYTNKKQSHAGLVSTALGIIDLLAIGYAIYFSYRARQGADMRWGSACALALVFSIAGIILALVGKSDEDSFNLLAYIGLILNIVSILAISVILYAGAYVL